MKNSADRLTEIIMKSELSFQDAKDLLLDELSGRFDFELPLFEVSSDGVTVTLEHAWDEEKQALMQALDVTEHGDLETALDYILLGLL